MSVTTLHAGGIVNREQLAAFNEFNQEICDSLERVLEAGVPIGFAVACLHGQLHLLTQRMLDND